jgi:pimeloyl-ACP methyl ester carboxylesterase
MSAVLPFTVAAAGAPDPMTAYWRCLCCAAGYLTDNAATLRALSLLVGATAVQPVEFPTPLPDIVYVVLFTGGVMVLTNGTTQPQQYLVQAAGALLQVSPYGPGQVNSYDLLAALAILATLAPILEGLAPAQVIYVGHSLGGAVTQLLAQRPQSWPVVGAWSAGQPRVGTRVWSQAYSPATERYTTPGDPVPMIPPSSNPLVDATFSPFWPIVPASYEHAGIRRYVFPDGEIGNPPEFPSWVEASLYLQDTVIGGTGWYGAHSPKTYAARIRQGIPVPWLGTDPDWPLIGQLDLLAVPLLGELAGVPSGELFTFEGAAGGGPGQFARQGICQ